MKQLTLPRLSAQRRGRFLYNNLNDYAWDLDKQRENAPDGTLGLCERHFPKF